MKLNQLLLMGVTFCLVPVISVSGSAVEALANLSSSSSATSNGADAVVAQKQTGAVMSGTFVAAEHATTGMARIVEENGHRYLELDTAFSTSDQGPDLHVILDPSARPPQAYQNPGSYVNLGSLQKFKGAQRYPIPDSVDLSNFKSVSIWCRMANATFGYAPLRPASTASTQ